MKINCPRACCLWIDVDVVADFFKLSTSELFPILQRGSARPATHCTRTAWVDRFSLNELRASVCFTPGSHLIPDAFVSLNCADAY